MKIFAVFLGIRIHGVKNFTEAGVNPAITQLLVTYFFLNNTTYKFYIIFQKMDLSQNIGDKNFLYEICEKQFSSDYDKKRHMKCKPTRAEVAASMGPVRRAWQAAGR